ncbi:hypothetical protein SEVIR_3G285433v4 [Setaria viridis]
MYGTDRDPRVSDLPSFLLLLFFLELLPVQMSPLSLMCSCRRFSAGHAAPLHRPSTGHAAASPPVTLRRSSTPWTPMPLLHLSTGCAAPPPLYPRRCFSAGRAVPLLSLRLCLWAYGRAYPHRTSVRVWRGRVTDTRGRLGAAGRGSTDAIDGD